MTATEKENQHDLLYIFLIGLLSLLIRLWGLGEQGLNYDETQSVTHAILPLPDLLKSVLTFDPHPRFTMCNYIGGCNSAFLIGGSNQTRLSGPS